MAIAGVNVRRPELNYNWFQRKVLGFKTSSIPGSNNRRAWSRASLFIILAILLETMLANWGWSGGEISFVLAGFAPILALAFFAVVVLSIPFLTSQNFQPDPVRLAWDTLISILLNITCFSVTYRALGIVGPTIVGESPLDHIYFSAVTFSTLGFGDFQPAENARLVAAGQAIIGNLHLGIIVGTAFLAVRPSRS